MDDTLITWLRQQKWSDYARKLLIQYEKTGSLNDQQIETATRMRERSESRSSN